MRAALDEESVSSTREKSRSLPGGLAESGYPADRHLLLRLQKHYDSDPEVNTESKETKKPNTDPATYHRSLLVLKAGRRSVTMPRKVTCYHSRSLENALKDRSFGTEEAPIVHLPWVSFIYMETPEWFFEIIYRLDPKHYQVQYTDDIFGPGDTRIGRLLALRKLRILAGQLKCGLIGLSVPRAVAKLLRQLRVPYDTDDELRRAVVQFYCAYLNWSRDADTRRSIIGNFCRLVDVPRAMSLVPADKAIKFRGGVLAHWHNMQTESGTNPVQHSTAASEGMEGIEEETAQGL